MKNSTKRFCLKLAAGFLSTTLVASLALPLNVLATENSNTARPSMLSENSITTTPSDETNWSDRIVSEITKERTEFSKTYLLDDSSYYTVTSGNPLHEYVDGKWIDISNELEVSPATITEAAENIALLTDSEYNHNDSAFITRLIGTSTENNGVVTMRKDGALLIKPQSIYNYTSNNKLVLKAELSLDLTLGNTTDTRVIAKEVDDNWDIITTLSDVTDGQLIDYTYAEKSSTVTGIFNITDIFSKWERGTVNKNGIALLCTDASTRIIPQATNPVLTVRYIDVSENSAQFTNHTLDMGSAGTLYVNDVTNTAKVEQNIIGIDSNVLPVSLTKKVSATEYDFDAPANICSSWNYENAISLDGTVLTWQMFDNTIIRFARPTQNLTVENGYEKWLPVSNVNLPVNASLWISEDAVATNGLNVDYSQCYIESLGTRYNFNIYGKVSSIVKGSQEMIFTYGNTGVSSIVDGVGNKYIFSYSQYTVGIENYVYVSNITVKDVNNNTITVDGNNYSVNFVNTYDSTTQKISSTTTFCDGKTAQYVYDLNGRLLETVDAEGRVTVIHYVDNTSNIITGFAQYSSAEKDTIVNSLSITDDNTFSRTMIDQNGEYETMRFDANYNLITHHYKENIVSLDYNETKSITAYAYKNTESVQEDNYIFNPNFTENPIGWSYFGDIDPIYNADYQAIEIVGSIDKTAGVFTEVEELLLADKTYILEAMGKTTNVITNTDEFFGIEIRVYDTEFNVIDNLYYKFDNTLANEWQLRMVAFKYTQDVYVDVLIYEEGLTGTFYIDNVSLYEASEENAIVGLPNIENSSPVLPTYDENGNLIEEKIEYDSQKMIQSYSYNDIGSNLISSTDYNGLTTYYSYDSVTGMLQKTGYAKDSNGEIIDATLYDYNATGLLKSVSQTITDVTSSNTKTISTSYTYDDANRIESVTNNGTTYSFEYDAFGNLSKIKEQFTGSEESILSNYSYTDKNQVNSITYMDGTRIVYIYNDSDRISSITAQKPSSETEYSDLYTFSYSYAGAVLSEVLLTYNDSYSDDLKIVYTDTGYELYRIVDDTCLLIFSKNETKYEITEQHLSNFEGSSSYEEFKQTKYLTVDSDLSDDVLLSSTVSGERVSLTDSNSIVEFESNHVTTIDGFDRVLSRDVNLNSNKTSNNGTTVENIMSLSQDYSYSTYSNNSRTCETEMIDSIVSTVSNTQSSTVTSSLDYELHYKYDDRGRVQFIYGTTNELEEYVLLHLYAYDEADQLVTEINNDIGFITQYSYDQNGNITHKHYYDGIESISINNITATESESLFAISKNDWNAFDFTSYKSKQLSLSGIPAITIEMTYDGNKLLSYTEKEIIVNDETNDVSENVLFTQSIDYNDFGYPETHIENTAEGRIIYNLKWNGNQLAELEKIGTNSEVIARYIYYYDQNGYRTQKVSIEQAEDSALSETKTTYIWNDGVLQSMRVTLYENTASGDTYVNFIYDEKGNISGCIGPDGNPMYYLKDANGNIYALINNEGEKVIKYSYDAYGMVVPYGLGDNVLERYLYQWLSTFNPCTYKGYLYDYDTGLYFIKDRCYSPTLGRFIDKQLDVEQFVEKSLLSANIHTFCENNPICNDTIYGSWANNNLSVKWTTDGFNVEMSKAFLSRTFCILYANQLAKDYGVFDFNIGNSVNGMGVERIAANLFACSVGNYAENAINRVNATWGDGWLATNKNTSSIAIYKNDPYKHNYMKIWRAAATIRNYALLQGIIITV